jgi:O-antigen ligase
MRNYMTKKNLYILIGILGLVFGTASAFIPVKYSIAMLAGVLAVIFLLLDYQRITYVVALYPILYFITNKVLDIPVIANTWDELLLLFCIGVLFFKWFFLRKDKPYSWTPLEFPLILFFAVGLFLFLVKAPDGLGLDGLRATIEYILFFFIVVQFLRSEQGARRMIYVMVFSGAYMGFVGIYQYIAKVDTPTNWMDKVETKAGPRVFSIIGNPNALGALLVLLIPLAVALVLSEDKLIKKIVFSISALAMTGCLIFTGSRSSWIGLAVTLLIYSLISGKKKLIIALAAVAILAYIFVPSVQNRIYYMTTPEYITSSLRDGRFARWPKAIEMFMANIWYGVGFGRFGGSVAALNKVRGSFYIDNYYIKIAVEMGLFGLISFILILYNALAWSIRAVRRVTDNVHKALIQSIFSGMCGVLVTNVVLNNFDAPSVMTYFWSLAGVAMYLGYVNVNKNKINIESA